MILFLDSNVTIGYVFFGDDWHHHSQNVIKCPNKKYYSVNVFNETTSKIESIKKKIYRRLLILSSEILRNPNISDNLRLEDLHRIIDRKRLQKLKPYLDKLFKGKGYYEVGKEQIHHDIKQVANDFLNEYLVNFHNLKRILILHKRNKDYPRLDKTLQKCGVHQEDNLIIIDAHDLCNHVKNPLTFITADSKPTRDMCILDNTHITKIKDLRYFYIDRSSGKYKDSP